MKRIQLFEFEDLPWFPSWLRNRMTRYITVVHRLVGTREVLTPMIRPMTWQQIVFTYFVPLVPLFVAWDAAISNIRTHTLTDMQELTLGLDDAYLWESGQVRARAPGKMLYLLGQPG